MSGGGRNRKAADGRRAWVCSAVLGLVLFTSLAVAVFARDLVQERYPDHIQPFTSWFPESTGLAVALMAVLAVATALAYRIFLVRFDAIDASLGRIGAPRWLRWLRLEFDRGSVLAAMGVVLVFWAPIIFIMYPTGLTVDTFNQLYQFDTTAPTYYPTTGDSFDAEFIDHHPVFDTLLYGAFWSLGGAVGSQNAGLFLLVLLQSAVLAAELAALCCYLQRLGVPWVLRLLSLAFVALFPFFAHYAATVLKDVTYLTFFLPWLMMWVEAVRTGGDALRGNGFLAVFMVLGGFCILSKKLGVFVLVPCLLLLLLVLRGRRVRMLVSSAATLALFCAVLPAVVYPAIGGVAPGGLQEALGPAIQQVTATLREDPDSFSQQERDDLNRVFDTGRAQRKFELFRSDGAKSAYHSSATRRDIGRFLQIWAEKGVSHPGLYASTAFTTSGMLYIPFIKLTYYDDEDYSHRAEFYESLGTGFSVDIGRPRELVAVSSYLQSESPESRISDLPGISLFFTEGFYGGWIPVFALVTAVYARRRGGLAQAGGASVREGMVLALAPLLVSMLLLLACPVASPRYILPFLFSAPLALGWAWFCLRVSGKARAAADAGQLAGARAAAPKEGGSR